MLGLLLWGGLLLFQYRVICKHYDSIHSIPSCSPEMGAGSNFTWFYTCMFETELTLLFCLFAFTWLGNVHHIFVYASVVSFVWLLGGLSWEWFKIPDHFHKQIVTVLPHLFVSLVLSWCTKPHTVNRSLRILVTKNLKLTFKKLKLNLKTVVINCHKCS